MSGLLKPVAVFVVGLGAVLLLVAVPAFAG
jgi:hypothetical protein